MGTFGLGGGWGIAVVPVIQSKRKLVTYGLALLTAFLWLGMPTPAAALIFTIDGDGDGFLDLDGSDDVAFSFTGSTGTGTAGSSLVSGTFRAVSILISDSDIAAQVGTTGFAGRDVLVFDVVLNAGSAIIDQIGVAVATNPVGLNPTGAGYLVGPGETTAPTSTLGVGAAFGFNFFSGFGVTPGSFRFNFGLDALNAGNLSAGETTRRLFLTWADDGAFKPLEIGQTATFMMSSGTPDTNFLIKIVPEPDTLTLVAGGLLAFALWRRRRD